MTRNAVLIVDDEENLRALLTRIIELEGYAVYQAADGKSSLKILDKEAIQVVVLDVKLPDANGIELTSKIKSRFPDVEIILLTAFGTIQDGVTAIKNGAFDYVTKGDQQNKIIPLLAKASEKALLRQKISSLETQLSRKFDFSNVIGDSRSIREAIALGKKVAATDTTVLLTGETGTGKEVFAKAIHYTSPRMNKPFVAVNCSALGDEILESELFGHKEGAFTGASRDKIGLFQEAHEGAVFLDEIGEMSVKLQAKLLRVLESGTFIPVGGTKEMKVNVRVIAATNRDLRDEIVKGQFREDLFYRLSVFQISLPSLRDRSEDIQPIAEFFVHYFAGQVNSRINTMSPDFLSSLKRHAWKGNVRELKNVIERAVILADQEVLTPSLLPYDFDLTGGEESSMDLAVAEKAHIRKVLAANGGNKTKSARLLNISLTTLYHKIKEYNL